MAGLPGFGGMQGMDARVRVFGACGAGLPGYGVLEHVGLGCQGTRFWGMWGWVARVPVLGACGAGLPGYGAWAPSWGMQGCVAGVWGMGACRLLSPAHLQPHRAPCPLPTAICYSLPAPVSHCLLLLPPQPTVPCCWTRWACCQPAASRAGRVRYTSGCGCRLAGRTTCGQQSGLSGRWACAWCRGQAAAGQVGGGGGPDVTGCEAHCCTVSFMMTTGLPVICFLGGAPPPQAKPLASWT